MICNDSASLASEVTATGNACAGNSTVSTLSGPVPSDTNGTYTTPVHSTVCGNGIKEDYEECDDGTVGLATGTNGTLAANGATPGTGTAAGVGGNEGNGASTSNCSTICRCAGVTSYQSIGSGPWGCQ